MSDGLLEYLPEADDNPYPLGRNVVWHDPQNRAYPVRPLLAAQPRRYTRPHWARHRFHQRGSSCTFQSAWGVALTSPFRHLPSIRAAFDRYDTEEERHAAYLRAQNYDPWAGGEPQYEGSSTDAPFKVLREDGIIGGWRWLFGIQDMRDTLTGYGPFSGGTVWLRSMFTVDKKGYVVVDPDSGDAGGHAYEWLWWDEDDDDYLILNSWGPWGRNGRAKIRGKDAEYLMIERQGEAATVVL